MLFYQTIAPATLELLKKLMNVPGFDKLRLVGGTALALQYGHRKSIDIDLFGKLAMDEYALSNAINQTGEVTTLHKTTNINIYSINGIKVDIVDYPYPWIDEMISIDGMRLASPKDISAMKLAAIVGRGSKKDFVDLYVLLKRFSLQDLLGFYERKFADGSVFMVIKSLTYFDDAEKETENPIILSDISWLQVKTSILNAHREFVNGDK